MHLVLVVIAVGVNVLLQLLLCRSGCGLLRSVFAGFGCGLLLLWAGEVAFSALTPLPLADTVGWLVADTLIFGSSGYAYFHFINMTETARRIRILSELFQNGGRLSREELVRRYDARDMVARRLERLLGKGQIVETAGRYRVRPSLMLLAVQVIVLLKKMLFGKASEFE